MLRAFSLRPLLAVFAFPAIGGAVHVVYDKAARAIANQLKPPGLTAKANPNGLKQAGAQIAAALTELEKSGASNGPGAHALLKTAYEKFRPEVGPAHRAAAIAAVENMWLEARALGAFDEAHQYTGKITKGADAGGVVVLEYIVPIDLDPRFSADVANIRIVPPSRARAKDAPPTRREVEMQKNLDAIAREVEGMKNLEKAAKSVPTDSSGLTKEEALKRWKAEVAENGAAALELPSIVLKGMMTGTPSKRNGYKWQFEADLTNLSNHATEVEVQLLVIGSTWRDRENYIMIDKKQKVQLRSIQRLRVPMETLEERTYKSRGDLYEGLDKKQIARSQANYRGAIWRVTHAKGDAAVFATDNALLEMLNGDSKRNVGNMAKLYMDPKDWPKKSSTSAGK